VRDLPNHYCNVISEIPMNGESIEYELVKEANAMHLDRYVSTAMLYPCK
jgi:inorganic pyrophosphatase